MFDPKALLDQVLGGVGPDGQRKGMSPEMVKGLAGGAALGGLAGILLGGKGANLAEMSKIGLPVPAGFTITTEVCTYFYANKLQYPPQKTCQVCGGDTITWKEVAGKGHIATYIVIEDGRLNRRMPDQPYNLAMVTLDADPTVNFYSNLPGTPPYKVPVGAPVEVTFEEVAPGQLIHEWRVVG